MARKRVFLIILEKKLLIVCTFETQCALLLHLVPGEKLNGIFLLFILTNLWV